ncbi:hypothetical protein CJD50_10525 [Hafnia paralvei]|uniref:Uncharacterized protein n=1 Tax=Hafnia paralvei TaxID=546367 RepID=A0A2A2MDJ2_9GAMM|nr:hypothetical protein CJD50_10525 [Hafnia paralvei]TBL53391.1 hypothetical protein EYZ00_09760 [Hafnia paralvei]
MPIVVRSVKTGMMKRGNPRSGLGGGAKLGCRGAAIGPPTRTPARSACRFRCSRRTKPYFEIAFTIRTLHFPLTAKTPVISPHILK